MAIAIGTVRVPMQITISAGSPAREIGTVTTEMKLGITVGPRPIGASSVTVQPDTADLHTSVARALREAANEIEQRDNTDPSESIYLDR